MLAIPRYFCIFVLYFTLCGCGPRSQPTPAPAPRDDLVDMARARPIADILQARFHIKLRSSVLDLAGSTGGGLVVERPGRGYLAILGPLGSPLLTAASDGEAMGVMIAKGKRYLVAEDAEQVLSETTSGVAGMDDVLALLVGDLPFDKAAITSSKVVEPSGRQVEFSGPSGTRVEAIIDARTATPRALSAFDEKGGLVLKAEYGEFEAIGESLMPKSVDLFVPELGLTIGLRYKGWSTPEEAPDVFKIESPEGMTVESLNEMIAKLVTKRLEDGKDEATEEAGDQPAE